MKPNDIAKTFSEFIEDGTTAKGIKVKSFFSRLPDSQKRLVANNISRAYADHLKEEKAKLDLRKKKKKEIGDLKRRAKELGLVLSEK